MRHIIFLNGIWPVTQSIRRPQISRAISCYQLKHWLSLFGFQSQVIDFCPILSADEIFDLLEQFVDKETFAIGVSTTFWPADRSVPHNLAELFPRIREKWPNLKIISGGARKPWQPELFDKYFIGESENELLSWCQYQAGKTHFASFNKQFDIVDLQHRFTESDAILPGEALPIELGRGCIFKCKFCAHKNLGKAKHTYQRRFDLILNEIRHNYEQFGTTKYMFLDDTVNEDLDKIKNFSTFKKELGFDIEWTGYLRADLVWSKTESAELLQQSGMVSCFFGVETFHNEAGRSIDKGWGAKHGKEFLPKLHKDIWKGKINMHVNLIAGLPYEPMESLQESLKWCHENDIGYHNFAPLTLYVEKNDENASSEFTRNYANYGYKNVNSETGYWENDQTNLTEMIDFCNEARVSLYKKNRVSAWDVFQTSTLGISTEQSMNTSFYDHTVFLVEQKERFKNMYLEKLRGLRT